MQSCLHLEMLASSGSSEVQGSIIVQMYICSSVIFHFLMLCTSSHDVKFADSDYPTSGIRNV